MRILLVVLLIMLAGCATAPYPTGDIGRASTPGIYHEVQRGQTLWHISKIYDIDLRRIINSNRLPDASKIEVGQLIFVPGLHDKSERDNYYAKKTKFESFIWPVKGRVVSYFGSVKNLTKNKGIDIRTRKGTNVVASRSGKAAFVSNYLKGYGKTIIIDHLDGFQTVYAHNMQNLVEVDERVKQGRVIAKVGSSGRVTRPTLHFEIRKKHKPQNPFYYLP